MSDSDEDYMSDKLLQNCEKGDIRPGLIYNRTQKHRLEIYKKTLASQQKPYKESESEVREKGLNTAISSENKGFKLLEKMGYKAGSSLGKSEGGLTQPIPLKVKVGSAGVGHKNPVEERKRKKLEKNNEAEKKFRAFKMEQEEMWTLKKDLRKAQKACEDLDFRNEVTVPEKEFFWTKETFEHLVKKNEEDEDDEEDDDEEPEEENKETLNERLEQLLQHLREKYYYCIYCVAKGSDIEDLNSFCPGMKRSDHNEEDL